MLYLFTALYAEARPLIQALDLKQMDTEGSLRQFQSRGNSSDAADTEYSDRILLTVMGSGPVKAAYAAGVCLGNIDRSERNECILYGSAAADLSYGNGTGLESAGLLAQTEQARMDSKAAGPLYLAASLENTDSGRIFYPDPIGRRYFPLAKILTGSKIYKAEALQKSSEENSVENSKEEQKNHPLESQKEYKKSSVMEIHAGFSACLHDMEAAAFYEAASGCLGPDQIHILKYVSDFGKENEKISAKDLEQNSEKHLSELLPFIRERLRLIHDDRLKTEGSETTDSAETMAIRASELHASITMEKELQQLQTYGRGIGFSFAREKKTLEEEGLYPCPDKRAGSRTLERIRKDLLAAAMPVAEDSAVRSAEKNSHTEAETFTGEESKTADRLKGNQNKSFQKNRDKSWLVYVEEGIWDRKETREILDRIPDPKTILPIRHYKDLFNRRRQDTVRQHFSKTLILAEKKGRLIYPGAPVCQDFGNRYFYYTSCIMNCLFDCDYCYLKGMYPSGLPVIFVNLEDTFRELEEILEKHPVYLSVSYDTDLVAVENLTSYVRKWTEFTLAHPDLLIEIRTKSGRSDLISGLTPCDRVIFALTISPEEIRKSYEHQTGSLKQRLALAKAAVRAGFKARLCFDPMIYVSNWKEIYGRMLDQVREEIDLSSVMDFSVGSFRISDAYLKQMRRVLPDSPAVQFPFMKKDGTYQYPDSIAEEMETYLVDQLSKSVPREKIFLWEDRKKEKPL
jgi:spore photoproduct lyase